MKDNHETDELIEAMKQGFLVRIADVEEKLDTFKKAYEYVDSVLNQVKEQRDKLRSALQVILTWATFEYQDLPRGHALDPKHVEDLCRKVLEATTTKEAKKEQHS